MPKRLDKILVIDVESTCWAEGPPAGQESEIIEIGFCLLDVPTLSREGKRSLLLRPERSTISPFCTQLTSLTPADVAQGLSFAQACDLLRHKYHSRDRVWASYGDYDRRQFERQCQSRNIAYPFGPSHLNIKNILALIQGWPAEVGLAEAMEQLGGQMEGHYHRGHDDAWNIGWILARLLQQGRLLA